MQLPKGLHHRSEAFHLLSRVHHTLPIRYRSLLPRLAGLRRHRRSPFQADLRLGFPDHPGPPDLLALLHHLRVGTLASTRIPLESLLSVSVRLPSGRPRW